MIITSSLCRLWLGHSAKSCQPVKLFQSRLIFHSLRRELFPSNGAVNGIRTLFPTVRLFSTNSCKYNQEDFKSKNETAQGVSSNTDEGQTQYLEPNSFTRVRDWSPEGLLQTHLESERQTQHLKSTRLHPEKKSSKKERKRSDDFKSEQRVITFVKGRTFFVHGVPDYVTVNEVEAYFKTFGDVKLVNLVLKNKRNTKANIAYVVLDESVNIDRVLNMPHHLAGSKLIVNLEKDQSKVQDNGRCRIVLATDIGEEVTAPKVRRYFDRFGPVLNIVWAADNPNLDEGSAIVYFKFKEHAFAAAESTWHEIGSSDVKVRLLGIWNEESSKDKQQQQA